MEIVEADVAIVGAGGAGLRAAIAAAETDPSLKIALISKVYPMRSHTVAAEGGSAGVVQSHDSLEHHFNDTVTGGDWLCEQDVVEYFVANCTREMVQLEHWGCPWSRKEDGHVNVRAFGGMKIERTWFAADKTGFHLLHTLFQTSIKYPSIQRFDEFFCSDLMVEDGRCEGVLAIQIATGKFFLIKARAVIIATGGAGRVFRQSTNGGIVTGDGMALAYRQGVPLRDMEFVQYHPTAMPGTGLLFTEACRGEGGILVNGRTTSPLPGLYAIGECSSVGIHGANRLGSNSLAELCVFGKVAGEEAALYVRHVAHRNVPGIRAQAEAAHKRALAPVKREHGTERISVLRKEMAISMEQGCGIYRIEEEMQATCRKLDELRDRYHRIKVDDKSSVWNTDWLQAIELGFQLDVAQAMAYSALNRRESRGAHQRLDGYGKRDDVNFLKHTLARYTGDSPPNISYGDVKITRSPPAVRAYGAAGEQAEKAQKEEIAHVK